MIIKSVSLGVYVDQVYLINKLEPIYMIESLQEGMIRIFDFGMMEIIYKIELRLDIFNVFSFDYGSGGILSC